MQREMLKSKRKDMKSQDLGNKKRKAEPLSPEGLQRLKCTQQIHVVLRKSQPKKYPSNESTNVNIAVI